MVKLRTLHFINQYKFNGNIRFKARKALIVALKGPFVYILLPSSLSRPKANVSYWTHFVQIFKTKSLIWAQKKYTKIVLKFFLK